ncbi:MAG: hypothetical protein RR849_06055 [Comamonas sp.]
MNISEQSGTAFYSASGHLWWLFFGHTVYGSTRMKSAHSADAGVFKCSAPPPFGLSQQRSPQREYTHHVGIFALAVKQP